MSPRNDREALHRARNRTANSMGSAVKANVIGHRAKLAHLRFIITDAWINGRPMRSKRELSEALALAAGERVAELTIEEYLQELGAVMIAPAGTEGRTGTFYIVPPYAADADVLRRTMSADVIAIETDARLSAYVIDIYCHRDKVFINVERDTAHMVAQWLVLNPWPEMMHVHPSRDSIVIFCWDEQRAEDLWNRINRQYEHVPAYRNARAPRLVKRQNVNVYFRTEERAAPKGEEEE
jgi:arginine repressor